MRIFDEYGFLLIFFLIFFTILLNLNSRTCLRFFKLGKIKFFNNLRTIQISVIKFLLMKIYLGFI